MRIASVAILIVIGLMVVPTAGADVWLIEGGPAVEDPAVAKGALRLTDLLAPGGEVSVECTETTWSGTVGPGADGEFKEATFGGCKFLKNGACVMLLSVSSLNTPWATEIFLPTNVEFRDSIFNANKTSGIKLVCTTVLGGTAEDACTGTTNGALQNAPPAVDLIFESLSTKLTCTIGGGNSGDIEGTLKMTSTAGELSVS